MTGGEKAARDQAPTVACEVCLKEIPASEARSEEASDYVIHFCGLECYAKWKARDRPVDETRED